jgi:hypothetical protein
MPDKMSETGFAKMPKSKLKNHIACLAVATLTATLCPSAVAAFTLIDGDFEYEQRNTDLGSSDLSVGGGPDNLFQDWWFYRLDGDTAESVFPSDKIPTSSTANTAVLSLAPDPAFDATLEYTATDLGDGEGAVLQEMTIFNQTSEDLVIDLFYYVDLDVDGSAGSDTATLAGPNRILFEDGSAQFSAIGSEADAFQVTQFAALRGLLEDGAITNLDNSGVPFGPGDATTAFQWSLLIPTGGSATVTGAIGIGDFDLDDLTPSVPEPGSVVALLGLGLGVLATQRKKQA